MLATEMCSQVSLYLVLKSENSYIEQSHAADIPYSWNFFYSCTQEWNEIGFIYLFNVLFLRTLKGCTSVYDHGNNVYQSVYHRGNNVSFYCCSWKIFFIILLN